MDKIAEEICLSLASDDLHYKSKHELKSDIKKEKNKYLQTIAVTLHFLQYHNSKTVNKSSNRRYGNGLLLTQDVKEEKS